MSRLDKSQMVGIFVKVVYSMMKRKESVKGLNTSFVSRTLDMTGKMLSTSTQKQNIRYYTKYTRKVRNIGKNMDIRQAIKAMYNGKKVRLPSWEGYWFLGEDGLIYVKTFDGKILDTPDFFNFGTRKDWEEVKEGDKEPEAKDDKEPVLCGRCFFHEFKECQNNRSKWYGHYKEDNEGCYDGKLLTMEEQINRIV